MRLHVSPLSSPRIHHNNVTTPPSAPPSFSHTPSSDVLRFLSSFLTPRNTFRFFLSSCLALAEEEAACVVAGSELQAYQLVDQPLGLSRDEGQVL